MCLQETHWELHDQALWTQSLLVKHIFASCTIVPDECRRPGADNSRKGGVATLLPAGYHFTEGKCFILVPGHATLTEINGPGCKWLVLNTYLRPEDPAGTWHLIITSPYFPTEIPDHFIAVGDLNTDLVKYCAGQSDPNRPIPPSLVESGFAVVLPPKDTHWRNGQSRTLDGGIVPPCMAGLWQVEVCRTSLSDHAILTFHCGAQSQPRAALRARGRVVQRCFDGAAPDDLLLAILHDRHYGSRKRASATIGSATRPLCGAASIQRPLTTRALSLRMTPSNVCTLEHCPGR